MNFNGDLMITRSVFSPSCNSSPTGNSQTLCILYGFPRSVPFQNTDATVSRPSKCSHDLFFSCPVSIHTDTALILIFLLHSAADSILVASSDGSSMFSISQQICIHAARHLRLLPVSSDTQRILQPVLILAFSFYLRIFIAKQTVCRLILFDRRKSSDRFIETVVIFIIVAHGNFSEQHCSASLFHMEVMIHIWVDCDTLSPVSA